MAFAALTCAGVRHVSGSSPAVHWTVAGSNLQRIGSLTFSLQNVSTGVVLVSLVAAAGQAFPKNWYERAVTLFGRTPFYVQAAAMALAVVAMQLLAGRGSAPFVYTRF